MVAQPIASMQANQEIIVPVPDPDANGCSLLFEPFDFLYYGFAAGKIVIEDTMRTLASTVGHYPMAVDPANRRDFKFEFSLFGVPADWVLSQNAPTKQILLTHATLPIVFKWKVLDSKTLKNDIIMASDPGVYSYQFTPLLPANTHLEINAEGDVEMIDDLIPANLVISRLKKPTAKDANNDPVGAAWRIAGGNLFLDLDPAGMGAAVYPVTVDPTVISSGGTFNSVGEVVVQDSAGFYYVIWVQNPGAGGDVKIRSSRDAFASTVTLLASGGGGIIDAAAFASHELTMSIFGGNLHLVVMQSTTGAIFHSICNDLPNWNLAASWKQSDTTTQGKTAVGLSIGASPDSDVDDDGSLYVIHAFIPLTSLRIKKWHFSTHVWTEATPPSGGLPRVPSVTVTKDGFLHIVAGDLPAGEAFYSKSSVAKSIAGGFSAQVEIITQPSGSLIPFSGVAERGDNQIVAFSEEPSTGNVGWNYSADSGATWLHGTGAASGSSTGLSVVGTPWTVGSCMGRSAAKEAYLIIITSGSVYTVLKFTGTTWISHFTISVGSGDTENAPKIENRMPAGTLMGVVYIDLQGGGADELTFDTFTPTAVATPVGGTAVAALAAAMGLGAPL